MQSDAVDDIEEPNNGLDSTAEHRQRPDNRIEDITQGLLIGFFFTFLPILFFNRPLEPIFWDDLDSDTSGPSQVYMGDSRGGEEGGGSMGDIATAENTGTTRRRRRRRPAQSETRSQPQPSIQRLYLNFRGLRETSIVFS